MPTHKSVVFWFVLAFRVFDLCAGSATNELGLNPDRLREIPQRLERFVNDQTISGAVTLVARHGQVACVDAIGLADLANDKPMRTNALFWIASMTKPITAIAILMLQDDGKLLVDDPVQKHLPEFRNQWLVEARTNDSMSLRRPPRPVTIRDLLTHTSGLGDVPMPRPDSSLAELVMAYGQAPLQFPPGSKWSYSNAGINTLGRVIEVVSGMPFAAFLQARLLDPLGMKDTTFWPTPEQLGRLAKSYRPVGNGRGLEQTDIYFLQGALGDRRRTALPSGGLFSTAADYWRICQMMLNGGCWSGKTLLSRGAVNAMNHTETGDVSTGFTEGMSYGYGFGVVKNPSGVTALLARGTFGHGGAYGTQAWIDPQKDMVMILMIQRANMPGGDASEVRRVFQETAIAAMER
jgi:CubicO group peptidase (beta-lactamase class C family)